MTTWSYASNTTPPRYRCRECAAAGVKLWREYNTFLNHQTLLCGPCALEEQNRDGPIDADGRRRSCSPRLFGRKEGCRTDTIGWRVPAVPDEENNTYWGYSAVPADGVAWWRKLPLTVQVE